MPPELTQQLAWILGVPAALVAVTSLILLPLSATKQVRENKKLKLENIKLHLEIKKLEGKNVEKPIISKEKTGFVRRFYRSDAYKFYGNGISFFYFSGFLIYVISDPTPVTRTTVVLLIILVGFTVWFLRDFLHAFIDRGVDRGWF